MTGERPDMDGDPNRGDRSMVLLFALFAVPVVAAVMTVSVPVVSSTIGDRTLPDSVLKGVFFVNGALASLAGVGAGLLIRGGGGLRALVAGLFAPVGRAFYLGALAAVMGIAEWILF